MLVVLPDAFHDNATQHAREHLLASLAFQGHQLVDGSLRAEWENLDMKSHFLLLHCSLFRSAGHRRIKVKTVQNFSRCSAKFAPEEQKHLARARKWLLAGFGNKGTCS